MFVALCVVLCGWFLASVEGAIEVSIIHFNDFHARFEPVNPVTGGICEKGAANTCMGKLKKNYDFYTENTER